MAIDWPDLDELKQVLDVTSDDWDGSSDDTRLTSALAAAIARVKADVGSWDDGTDVPDAMLQKAALRMAVLIATTPANGPETQNDESYARGLYGHRRRFAVS